MPPRKPSATSGISPTDNIPLEDFVAGELKRTAEKYKDDWGDEGENEDEDSLRLFSSNSDDSRYTLYSEPLGYVAPRDHREMELYIASIHGNREVVARIDHFIGPASKAKFVSLLKIDHSAEAALSNNQ